jgi:hypothetical protein
MVSNTITFTKPSGVAQNDLLIAVLNAIGWEYPPQSVPAGWALLDSVVTTSSSSNRVLVYYKVAGASEPATYVWTVGPNWYFGSGSVLAYSGVDPANPVSQHAAAARATGVTSSSTPSITTTLDGSMLISWWGNLVPTSMTVTTPSSDALRAAPSDTTVDKGAVSDQLQSLAGAASKTASFSAATTEQSGAGIVALNPLPVVTGPAATTAPSISGTPNEGETLSGNDGVWTGSPTSYARQWQRCDAAGSNCSAIAGATSSSYVVTGSDGGATIRFTVTATNSGGSTTALSGATAVVKRPPINTVVPAISGTTTEAWQLTVSDGTWANSPTALAQQWRQCDAAGANCTDIVGASAATYTIAKADVGQTLRAVITASNADGSAAKTSAATGVIGALDVVDAPDPAADTQVVQDYNGPWVSAAKWQATEEGGYELKFQRRTYGDWVGPKIYPCYAYVLWPRNTCGDDGIGYDGRTFGTKSFHQELWDEFGGTEQTAQSAGYLEPRDGNCGDLTGTDAPETNPCYARVWYEGAEAGPPSADAPATDDGPLATPASAAPQSPIGPAPAGSYSTETWAADEVDNDSGLRVVSSTTAGTAALTGIELDPETAEPIAGATVSLTCSSCASPTVTTTTGADGAFAFIDVPAGTYDLVSTAVGYGSYSLLNGKYDPEEEYELTINPTVDAQAYDESSAGALEHAAPTPVTETEVGTNYSQVNPPPSFIVRRATSFSDEKHCVAADGSGLGPPRNFSAPYFILHTIHPEVVDVPLTYTPLQMQAYISVEYNYAWFHKTKPSVTPPAFDVYADTRSLCFLRGVRVSRAEQRLWRGLLDGATKWRVVVRWNGKVQLKETLFHAGRKDEGCEQSSMKLPPVGDADDTRNRLYQYGLPHLGVPSSACYTGSDWKKMALWYYTFTDPWYVPSAKPPNPSTEPMTVTSSGDILFKFISSWNGKNVAWSYYLESRPCTMNDHDKCVAASRDAPWTRFKTLGWSAKARAVLTSYPYGGASGCRQYHVIAHGPAGNSLPTRFTRFTRQGPGWYCA